MNKKRRKQIDELVKRLGKVKDAMNGLTTDIETLRDEEQESFDNRSESLQQSADGQTAQQAAENLSSAADSSQTIDDTIDELENYLTEATS